MARRSSSGLTDKVEINMTPMIDVVFQLMSFFMCTLKVVAPEGDFDIRMPLGAAAAAAPDDQQVPPVRIKLTADGSGSLAGIGTSGCRPAAGSCGPLSRRRTDCACAG